MDGRASFGDDVRMYAKSQGLEESRDVLQEVGEGLVDKGPEDFCHSVLAHFGWHSGEPLVIDGVRHARIVDALRKIVAPLELRLVFIDVSEDARLKRLRKTDSEVIARIQDIESHSTEQEVVKNTLRDLAQRHVQGDRPIPDVVQEILGWVHQGDGSETPCNP